VIPVHAPPIPTVAIAVCHDGDGGFRYHAVGAGQSWRGRVDAPSKEAAIFNAMAAIRADAPGMDRVRFLVSLPGTSPLWRHAHEIAVLLSGSSVEWPGLTDLPLMEAARAGFVPPKVETPWPETAPRPPGMPPAPPDVSPLCSQTR
jgi:hypothetical protein